MTCAEFQRVLPYIIETGGNPSEESHLKSCEVCSDLVADLHYIADQAKLLVPMEEPTSRVWESIQQSLEREGLVKPGRARGRLLAPTTFPTGRPQAWMVPIAVAAVILFAAGILFYLRNASRSQQTIASSNAAPAASKVAATPGEVDDQQILAEVGDSDPSVRKQYEDSLRQVNAYISDARQSVERDPQDDEAEQALMQAYEQKAMLYEMAASRSLQ